MSPPTYSAQLAHLADQVCCISTTKTLGRAIWRLVSCYEPIMSLIGEADRRAIAAADDTVEGEPTTEDEIELMRKYVGYIILYPHY